MLGKKILQALAKLTKRHKFANHLGGSFAACLDVRPIPKKQTVAALLATGLLAVAAFYVGGPCLFQADSERTKAF